MIRARETLSESDILDAKEWAQSGMAEPNQSEAMHSSLIEPGVRSSVMLNRGTADGTMGFH
jgi:hypothetical protein